MKCYVCGAKVEQTDRVALAIAKKNPILCWLCYHLSVQTLDEDEKIADRLKGDEE